VRGFEFLDVLRRLIGVDETTRCLSKICNLETLDDKFHDQITNFEALAFYVYATANTWHSHVSPNFHEEEALLPTDCSFRVVDKEFQSVGDAHVKLVIVLQETTKRL
jgi:hypothetical protein